MKSFSIVICKPLDRFENLNNLTLFTLEQQTKNTHDEMLEKIFLEFGNKRKRIDFTLNPKVIFKKNCLNFKRCFHFVIDLTKQTKYQSLFSISKLIIELKTRNYELFLIPDHQTFNSKSFKYSNGANYVKKIIRTSKRKNCQDFNRQDLEFTNRWNRFDQCINKKYIQKHGNISIYSIIDRDHYTDDEWKRSYVEENETAYSEMKDECEKEIKEDCYKIEYDNDNLFIPLYGDSFQIELYQKTIRTTNEDPSLYKVVLNVLNAQSILFGLNMFQLFFSINLLINRRFKGNVLLIYFLCSIGLSAHT